LRLILLIAIIVASFAGFWWYATHSAASQFLSGNAPGAWIIYPSSIDPFARRGVDREAIFRRTFQVEAVPTPAILKSAAFKKCKITLNDHSVVLGDSGEEHWRQGTSTDVSSFLHKGENNLVVSVVNDSGPPALSLSLELGTYTIYSDDRWEVSLWGAIPRPAQLASQPRELRAGNPVGGGEKALESFRSSSWLILIFAGISSILMACVYHLQTRGREWFRALLWLGPAAIWLTLFLNNEQSLIFPLGFDFRHHLDYIAYIQDHGSLPLADKGWEMHQPPLYYVAAAALLRLFHLGVFDPKAVLVLSTFSLVLAISQVLLILGCLRLLFPKNLGVQAAGLLLAVFLPAHFYLFHYISNETLATTLATLAVYLCLRILTSPTDSSISFALLGVSLGAAMLTKVTAIVVVAVVLMALALRLLSQRRNVLVWLRTVFLAAAVCVLVSGWHYWRVWQHFGTPLVGNYDRTSSFAWWQEPGCSTLSYYFRFGRALTDPYFSAFHGYLDGLYCTLWGDGFWGGQNLRATRPPWNYDLMAAGYLVALVPSILILVGAVVALVRSIREPRPEWFLMIGLAAAFVAALVYQYLRFPYYGHVKAIYALSAAVSLCAFAACGFEAVVRRWKILGYLLGVVLATWALMAVISFWVPRSAPVTRAWLGVRLSNENQYREAMNCFEEALAADPDYLQATLGLARFDLTRSQRPGIEQSQAADLLAKANQLATAATAKYVNDPELEHLLGLIAQQNGQHAEALARFRRAAELGPDYWRAEYNLGEVLEQMGRKKEAIQEYRKGLAISPAELQLHRALARVLTDTGDLAEGVRHYQIVLAQEPLDVQGLVQLAWICLTSQDPKFRNLPKAMELALLACQVTGYKDPECLSTLGGAYAAAGHPKEAGTVLQQALRLASAVGKKELVDRIRNQLELIQTGKPFEQKR
jgi:tetratricopeptide (TPR) repeat protein